MESTSYVLSLRMVFFCLVTTGWIFDISLLCENTIKSIKINTTSDADPRGLDDGEFCSIIFLPKRGLQSWNLYVQESQISASRNIMGSTHQLGCRTICRNKCSKKAGVYRRFRSKTSPRYNVYSCLDMACTQRTFISADM